MTPDEKYIERRDSGATPYEMYLQLRDDGYNFYGCTYHIFSLYGIALSEMEDVQADPDLPDDMYTAEIARQYADALQRM
ncbi:MAG: hypothetical protein AAF653_11010 [Chloroflexota bacterium]